MVSPCGCALQLALLENIGITVGRCEKLIFRYADPPPSPGPTLLDDLLHRDLVRGTQQKNKLVLLCSVAYRTLTLWATREHPLKLIIQSSMFQHSEYTQIERRSFEVSLIGTAVVRRCERVKSEGDKGLSMFRFSLIYQNGHLQPDTRGLRLINDKATY